MVTNTTNNPQPQWLFGGNPRVIEAQEKAGQQKLLKSDNLPRKSFHGDVKTIYEKMGILVLEGNNKADPFFYKVKLPIGWKIISTDHSMYTTLLDEKGRKRASIFYKAAFYDRDASISFNTRYNYEVITYSDETSEKYSDIYERKKHTPAFGRVLDEEKVIFETKHEMFPLDYKVVGHQKWWTEYDAFEKSKRQECIDWLNKNYPNWEDLFAYW